MASPYTWYDVAQVLFMCEKSVQRYLALFYATGSVAPRDQKRGPDKNLTEFELFTTSNLSLSNQPHFCVRYNNSSCAQLEGGFMPLQSVTS